MYNNINIILIYTCYIKYDIIKMYIVLLMLYINLLYMILYKDNNNIIIHTHIYDILL